MIIITIKIKLKIKSDDIYAIDILLHSKSNYFDRINISNNWPFIYYIMLHPVNFKTIFIVINIQIHNK